MPGPAYSAEDYRLRVGPAPDPKPSFGDKALSWAGDNKALLAILASAGLGGTLGGVMSSRVPRDPEETPGQRRKRILMNVLGGGAAGAGIAGAGVLGYNELKGAIEGGGPGVASGSAQALKSTLGRLGLGTAGAAGGVISGDRAEAKSLKDLLFAQKVPSSHAKALGTGNFDEAKLVRALKTPGATAKGVPLTRTMEDAITQAAKTGDPKGFIRGMGYPVDGEGPMTAMTKKILATQAPIGTGMKLNPRHVRGGIGGLVGGFAIPAAWDWAFGSK